MVGIATWQKELKIAKKYIKNRNKALSGCDNDPNSMTASLRRSFLMMKVNIGALVINEIIVDSLSKLQVITKNNRWPWKIRRKG